MEGIIQMSNIKHKNPTRRQFVYQYYIKRSVDLILALILLIITSPFILIGCILVKVDSKGPVMFTQTRIGKECKEFMIYKLRTMKQQTHDESGIKLRDRERVTRAGKLIRKLSLDELPQLINIIKGEMSFIGPRPLLVRYLPYYTDEEIRRHNVLPGITGLAQINGRSFLNWEERFAYDVKYVDNISLKLDLYIVLKTIYKIFSGEGTSAIRPKNMVDFDEHRNYKKLR